MNTEERTMVIKDLTVKVIRKPIKRLNLAVYPPDGRVRISVPKEVDDETVRLAVISKYGWIKQKIKAIENRSRQSPKELINGKRQYYLGQEYLLKVDYCEEPLSVEIKNKRSLILHINEDTGIEQCKNLLIEWYRWKMKQILPGIVRKWEGKTDLQVQSYRIKRMKTIWGSCNAAHRRIWLNLELIKRPVICLEYVVVHEMVHFLEYYHNAQFMAHMDRFLPQWKTIKKELDRFPPATENW